MSARCIDCGAEIEEGPLCIDCAPLVAETIRRLKGKRIRPTRRDLYRAEPRSEPPITLAIIGFSKKGGGGMIFVAVKSYQTARRRYPRAAVIARVEGGFMCFASRSDYLKWKRAGVADDPQA